MVASNLPIKPKTPIYDGYHPPNYSSDVLTLITSTVNIVWIHHFCDLNQLGLYGMIDWASDMDVGPCGIVAN